MNIAVIIGIPLRHSNIAIDWDVLRYNCANSFRAFCSSHIIRSALYRIAAKAESIVEQYAQKNLGGHVFIYDQLDATGTARTSRTPVAILGAIHRMGDPEAHNFSLGILGENFFKRYLFKSHHELFLELFLRRFLTCGIHKEIFVG